MLRGVLAILFGLAAVFWPAITLATLVLLWTMFIIIDGIFEFVYGLLNVGKRQYWFLSMIVGVLQIIVGVFAFNNLEIAWTAVIFLVGLVAIGRGIFDLLSIFFVQAKTGVVNILFGFVLVTAPLYSSVALTWLIGLYALIVGPLIIAFSLHLRELGKEVSSKEEKAKK